MTTADGINNAMRRLMGGVCALMIVALESERAAGRPAPQADFGKEGLARLLPSATHRKEQ